MIKVVVLVLVLATSHVWSSATTGDSDQVHYFIERERQALLSMKQHFVNNFHRLSSWTSTRRDCCAWSGIRCDNLTHHIISLDLYFNGLGGEIGHSLVDLQHLRYLNLGFNEFTKIPEFIDDHIFTYKNSSNYLTNLEIFDSTIPPKTILWLLNISSNLINLTIANNEIKGPLTLPNSFENMRSLARIDLPENGFEGELPKSLGNLCNLQELVLSYNKFNSTLCDVIGRLIGCANNLEILDLNSNQFEGPLPNISTFSSYLRHLDASNNKLNGTLPEGIGELQQLKYLDLSSNSFTGALPKSIGKLQHLRNLDLSSNTFIGLVTEVHFQKLSKLNSLYLSHNSLLTLRINSTSIPPFQLDALSLRSCNSGPQFPTWLKTQIIISTLDLSNSEIHDEIPNWFFRQTLTLYFLNLSSNQFRGLIQLLDISNNMLNGSLPDCQWNMKDLIVLKLDNNNLSGVIPRSIGSLSKIQHLLLGHNNFSGNLPSSSKNCTKLEVLDIESNNLEGNIPSWIGERLTNLILLRIRSNNFYGIIPLNVCHLQFVRIFDISINAIFGYIPSCINFFTSMVAKAKENKFNDSKDIGTMTAVVRSDVIISIMWKGILREYSSTLGLLRVIDLSCNNLIGKIPEELTNLVELVQLNISRNNLNGTIPMEIGNLNKLDALDLSHNKLCGVIPTSLASISSLSFLDLSSNKLSGKSPPTLNYKVLML
ncbi:receptor-like protein 35 [Humulus lupulus]|uniref:receptor-like protein 35 n=1 Tax=Humulus lupulus TaxID=3486 RepID=UPI002B4113D2|nr:receptor-like protein 35 [Humulus lupulus]